MKLNLHRSLEAFVAIMSMDALADAQALRDCQIPIPTNGVRFSSAALTFN